MFWHKIAVLLKKSLQLVICSQLKLIVFYAPVSNVSVPEPEASHLFT